MANKLMKGAMMLLAVMTVALATTATTAYGQSARSTRATIPFDFVVGDKTMPAGNYDVAAVSSTGETLRIRNTANQRSAYRLSTSLGVPVANKLKLVFHRYGSEYYLAEVWGAGEANGRKVTVSSGEKAAAHEIAMVNARGGQAPGYELVEIVAVNR